MCWCLWWMLFFSILQLQIVLGQDGGFHLVVFSSTNFAVHSIQLKHHQKKWNTLNTPLFQAPKRWRTRWAQKHQKTVISKVITPENRGYIPTYPNKTPFIVVRTLLISGRAPPGFGEYDQEVGKTKFHSAAKGLVAMCCYSNREPLNAPCTPRIRRERKRVYKYKSKDVLHT